AGPGPAQEPLAQIRQTVLVRKSEFDRALRIQQALNGAEEFRKQGSLQSAMELLDTIAQSLAPAPELEAKAAEFRSAIAEREKAVKGALQKARKQLEASNPGEAVTTLNEAVTTLGTDARLQHFLNRAVLAQKEAARAAELERAVQNIHEIEQSGD